MAVADRRSLRVAGGAARGNGSCFLRSPDGGRIAELRLSGKTNTAAAAQTMFSAFSPDALAALWLGLRGPEQTLTGLCSVNTAAVQFTGWDLISLQPAASISISPFILIWGPAACSTATTATPDGHRSGVQPRPGWSDCAGRRGGASVMGKVVRRTVRIPAHR